VSGPGTAAERGYGRRLLDVIENRELGAYRLLSVADDGPAARPGQFAMIAAAERWGGGEDERPHLARAFSVALQGDGRTSFLLEDVGPGTRRLCELGPGEGLWVLAPLGRGFQAPGEGRRALLVGGGIGIAPLALLAGELARAGTPAIVLLGFRDGPRARGAELFEDAHLATDDGSVGHHGLVTDLLAAELERDPHAVVYSCGPAGMLEGVRAMCEQRGVPAQLALEAGMACGFGACYGCVVPRRGGGYLRVCVDGPVIDAAELEHVEAHAGAPE
jgi:dihydroorotate dehydrogenase electron transfer subunit